jgi:TPR repeat protein
LGTHYLLGAFGELLRESGLEYLNQSVLNGSPTAMFFLSQFYTTFLNVEPNPAKHLIWLIKAAELGQPDAQLELGKGYLYGRWGLPADTALAHQWLDSAAALGALMDHETRQHLELMVQRETANQDQTEEYQRILSELLAEAKKAVQLGQADRLDPEAQALAQYNLGLFYQTGVGTQADQAEAAKWLLLAAQQGLAAAQFDLAKAYIAGKGVPKDEALGSQWALKAAQQGHALAQLLVGEAYLDGGRGLERSDYAGLEWLKKAAQQALPQAMKSLAKVYLRDQFEPSDENYSQSLIWLKMAMMSGDTECSYILAQLYLKGERGLPRDPVTAQKYLRFSSILGYEPAKEQLENMENQ